MATSLSRRNRNKPPVDIDIDGTVFLFSARIGSKALEPLAREQIFESFQVLLVGIQGEDDLSDDEVWERFIAADLDRDELFDILRIIGDKSGMLPGESSASPSPSSDDEASSSPTSNAGTPSTSTSSVNEPMPTGSFT